jgi:hypothetical protein
MNPPELVDRTAQHYAAITARVAMSDIGSVVPPLVPEVFGWLAGRQVPAEGPPFFRYVVIDMERELEIEACVPTAEPVAAREREQVTADLLAWADGEGIGGRFSRFPTVRCGPAERRPTSPTRLSSRTRANGSPSSHS